MAEGGVDLRDEVQEIEEVMLGRWEASSIYIKCLGRSGSCVPERMTDLSYLFKGMRVAGHEAELGCQFHLSRQGHSSTRVGGGVGAGYQGYLDTLSLKGGARGGKGCALIAKEGGCGEGAGGVVKMPADRGGREKSQARRQRRAGQVWKYFVSLRYVLFRVRRGYDFNGMPDKGGKSLLWRWGGTLNSVDSSGKGLREAH